MPFSFPWWNPDPPRPAGSARAAMYRRELEQRAALLFRLGSPKAGARQRLQANVAWDFEIGAGTPPSPAEIAELVEAVYRRGGPLGAGTPTV
jgi:hypothetical protein